MLLNVDRKSKTIRLRSNSFAGVQLQDFCWSNVVVRPVWSETSLSAWRNLGSLATQWAHSEDSDQTGRTSCFISVFNLDTLSLFVRFLFVFKFLFVLFWISHGSSAVLLAFCLCGFTLWCLNTCNLCVLLPAAVLGRMLNDIGSWSLPVKLLWDYGTFRPP